MELKTLSLGAVNGTGFSSVTARWSRLYRNWSHLKDDGNMCANAQRLDAYFDDLKFTIRS